MSLIILKVKQNGQLTQMKQFREMTITIGSDPNLGLALNGPGISELHAMIELRGTQYYLLDLGGGKGTKLNETPILESILKTGDEIGIGEFKIVFSIGLPQAVQPNRVIQKESPQRPTNQAPRFELESLPPLNVASQMEAVAAATEQKPKVLLPEVPPSTNTTVRGKNVEFLLLWKDRVLNSQHFNKPGVISIGSHPKNDIIVPVISGPDSQLPQVKIGQQTQIFIPFGANGTVSNSNGAISFSEYFQNIKSVPKQNGYLLTLSNEESVTLNFEAGVSLVIRYVDGSASTLPTSWVDLSTKEILSITGVTLLMLTAALILQLRPTAKDNTQAPDQADKPQPKARLEFVDMNPVGNLATPFVSEEFDEIAKTEPEPVSPLRPKNTGRNLIPKKKLTGIVDWALLKSQLQQTLANSKQVIDKSKNASNRQDGAAFNENSSVDPSLKSLNPSGNGPDTVRLAGNNPGVKRSFGKNLGLNESGSPLGTPGKSNLQISAGGSDESYIGTFDREGIRRVVLANQNQLKACYEDALNRAPGLYGKIVLEWVIGKTGAVLEARVKSSTMNNARVEACSVKRVQSWQFPIPPRNQDGVVSFPFTFNNH